MHVQAFISSKYYVIFHIPQITLSVHYIDFVNFILLNDLLSQCHVSTPKNYTIEPPFVLYSTSIYRHLLSSSITGRLNGVQVILEPKGLRLTGSSLHLGET